MELCVLASGSRGNATLLRSDDTCILIDCGLTQKQLTARLAVVGLAPSDLSAVFVTHEHSDHAAGIGALRRQAGVPVHATQGTWRGMDLEPGDGDAVIAAASVTRIGALSVQAVTVPHDAREPVQFRTTGGAGTIGVITDLGHATPHVVEQFQGCDGLLLECNHDPEMLRAGRYPESLKQRISGRFGHLANGQAAELLSGLVPERLQFLIAAHLSEQNNTPDFAREALDPVIDGHGVPLHVATQHEPTEWFGLS